MRTVRMLQQNGENVARAEIEVRDDREGFRRDAIETLFMVASLIRLRQRTSEDRPLILPAD